MKNTMLLLFFCLIAEVVYSQRDTGSGGSSSNKGNPPQKNGDGILKNSYNRTACGLNYAVDSWMVTKRSAEAGTPSGLGMPATFNFTKLPNSTCFGVDTAFLWWILSDYQQICFSEYDTALNYCSNPYMQFDANFNIIWCCQETSSPLVSITNPDNITYADTGVKVGQDGTKKWSEKFTRTYRVGIPPSVISGNGTYTLNISGQDEYGIDGFMLMIIYRDPSATYQGTLIIDDGCFTRSDQDTTCGLPIYDSITGFNTCGNSSYANAFLLVSDLQRNVQPTFQAILNGSIVTDSANFFNFISTSTIVTAGQSISSFGIIPDTTKQDCYTLGITGLYYQTTSCVTCIPDTSTTPMQLTTDVTNDSCGNCLGTSTLAVSGGNLPYTYQWGVLANNQTDSVATGLCAGTYNVTVLDASTCTQQKDTSITIVSIGDISISSINNDASCNSICDGNATANHSGGVMPYTYQWDAAANNQTTQIATALCAGSYTVTVTDNNACTVTDTIIINAPTAITLSKSSTDASCGNADGTATISVSGGSPSYIYSWEGGQTTTTVTGLTAGTYNITVTDSQICTVTDVVVVSNIGAPTIITSFTAVTCYGGNNGTATVTASGGTPPFSYLWDSNAGSQTDSAITGLSAGIYSVTLTDAMSCMAADVVIISEPIGMSLSFSTTNESCSIGNDGSASVNVTGGQSPYNYQWDNKTGNKISSAIAGLVAGSYSITVTDNNGCTKTDSIIIQGVGIPVANFTVLPNTGYIPLVVNFTDKSAINNGTITSWQWNFGDGSISTDISPSNTYNETGSYEVILIVASNTGCVDTAKYQYILVKAKSNLIVYNVFSPNVDGFNDLFTVTSKDIISFYGVIYNRWGLTLYEWNDVQKGWDGRYNGKDVPDGTYYYIITAEGVDNMFYNKSGVVTLIR